MLKYVNGEDASDAHIDEDLVRWVKARSARTGKRSSEVIEDALRRELGLDRLERVGARNNLSEREALDLAVAAQHRTRRPGPERQRRTF